MIFSKKLLYLLVLQVLFSICYCNYWSTWANKYENRDFNRDALDKGKEQDGPLLNSEQHAQVRYNPLAFGGRVVETVGIGPRNEPLGEPCDNQKEYLSYPGDCSKFYRCANSMLYLLTCANGLYFDPVKLICDWPSNVQCNPVNSATSTNPPSTAAKTTLKATTAKPIVTTKPTTAKPATAKPIVTTKSTTAKPATAKPILTTKPTTAKPATANLVVTTVTTTLKPTTLTTTTAKPQTTTVDPCPCAKNISPLPCVETSTSSVISSLIAKSTTVAQPQSASSNVYTSSPRCSHVPLTTTCNGEPTPCGTHLVVCYFTNWAWYRSDPGKFLPEHIDPSLCTHIIYAFATLDTTDLTIKPYDSWADLDSNMYKRVNALASRGTCVLIAIGGWNDSAGDKYSRMCQNPASRAKFVTSVVQFLDKYGFSGIDIDWEYPTCPQGACSTTISDRQCLSSLLYELKTELSKSNYMLTIAVSANGAMINQSYDVPKLAEYVDWVNLMTYDFHGSWDPVTGHHAPLKQYPNAFPDFNVEFAVNYWLSMGLPACKLVVGVPTYARTFELTSSSNNGLNAPIRGPGVAGQYTQASGFLAYYEVCSLIKNNGWTRVVNETNKLMGPYAYSGTQWMSYDDCAAVKDKINLVRSKRLLGGMIWALDLDDFKGRCSSEAYPLLATINRELCRLPKADVSYCP